MSIANFGLSAPRLSIPAGPQIERILVHRPLNRILSFIGHSIDDLVNDPIVKGQVRGYFKLDKQIRRQIEIAELERTWNPVGLRF